jgi:DNA-binding NtrC family response regulator
LPTEPLRILLVDDEEIIHQMLSGYLRDAGHCVESVHDGSVALARMREADFDLSLVDVRMPGLDGLSLLEQAQEVAPDLSVVIITGHGNMEMVIQALRLGAVDFLNKPIKLLELDAVVEKARRVHKLRHDRRHLSDILRGLQTAENHRHRRGFVGHSAATRTLLHQVQQAVESRCMTILITGETGTGKEVVAREIHSLAAAKDAAFIAVNCPAIPEELVESELFGHVKGAFTGASADRAGYFEMADGGTLFLDEIADLSASAQAKLLRVLETRALRRVGGAKEIQVEVRVVAATNVDLQERIIDRTFRSDLYYRLNVFTIEIPPLRERTADILPLAQHFLEAYSSVRGIAPPGFTDAAAALLTSYHFPGNARELRNLVERAAILSRGHTIDAEHLTLPTPRPAPSATGTGRVETQDDASERSWVLAALEEARWNRRVAAKALGISYSALRHRMQRLGIS